MSTELLEALKTQAASLTAEERLRLAQYLMNNVDAPPSNDSRAMDDLTLEEKRRKRAGWLVSHREEYAGQYVALDGDSLLGTGRNYVEAASAAARAGVRDAYIDYVHSPDGHGYAGGW